MLVERFQQKEFLNTRMHHRVTDLRSGIVYAPAGLYGNGVCSLTPLPTQECGASDFRGFARVLQCRVLSAFSNIGASAQTELLLEPIAAPSR